MDLRDSFLAYSPEHKYLHLLTTEETESTEGLCPYFFYSVFSVLSVVKVSPEIGEGISVPDYK